MEFSDHRPLDHARMWRPGPLAYAHVSAWWIIWVALAVAGYALRDVAWLPEIVIAALLWLGGWIGISTLELRVMRLTYDEGGVWWYRGIWPWSKGSYLVKWRDLETLAFSMGFSAWLTRSYPVTIVERFTDRPEVRLPPIWHGNEAVTEINQHLIGLLHGATPTTG